MSSDNEEVFDVAQSGASAAFPMQAGAVKKNGFCMLKGKPCRVVDYSTSKTGKHGHAKAHIVGLDIFTGKKYEDMCPTSHNVEVPVVKRAEYQLIGIDDGYVTLLNEAGDTKSDLKLPVISDSDPTLDEVGKKIAESFEAGSSVLVSVLSACGIEKIVGYKMLDN